MQLTLEGLDTQDALSVLRNKKLERIDGGDFRVYKDVEGKEYHSVTHILGETKSKRDKEFLAKWLAKPGNDKVRNQAASRGTKAHSHCEYILKTASQLIRNTCNERNSWKTYEDGLARSPKSITEWAIKKATGASPKVHWMAELHARGLAEWINGGKITSIHSVEFSIYHPLGFAGTADCLLDIDGKLTITDFKTTGSFKDKPDKYLEDYFCQLGAYNLGLKHLTGIQAKQAAVIIAKEEGDIQERILNEFELLGAMAKFEERMHKYNKLH